MILADTSIWIGHLRRADTLLEYLLDTAQVMIHPFIFGEIALGSIKHRQLVLASLADLPVVTLATADEVIRYIDTEALAGTGIGYVDAHLLVSARLTPDVKIWTHDKRLGAVALVRNLTMVEN